MTYRHVSIFVFGLAMSLTCASAAFPEFTQTKAISAQTKEIAAQTKAITAAINTPGPVAKNEINTGSKQSHEMALGVINRNIQPTQQLDRVEITLTFFGASKRAREFYTYELLNPRVENGSLIYESRRLVNKGVIAKGNYHPTFYTLNIKTPLKPIGF